jgi:hypothetical protein
VEKASVDNQLVRTGRSGATDTAKAGCWVLVSGEPKKMLTNKFILTYIFTLADIFVVNRN